MRKPSPREELPPLRRHRDPPGPIPTLGEIRKDECWVWAHCERCPHSAPLALAPLIIRWGPDASSNVLRRAARCSQCGGKGAMLMAPSWGDTETGTMPFPAGE